MLQENSNKQEYERPAMTVVELQHTVALLETSKEGYEPVEWE